MNRFWRGLRLEVQQYVFAPQPNCKFNLDVNSAIRASAEVRPLQTLDLAAETSELVAKADFQAYAVANDDTEL